MLLLLWFATGFGSMEAPPTGSPESIKHFEARVRPLLVEKCQKCHASERQRGGLRLDSREGALLGGDSGPALVPGDPDKSLLMKMVRQTEGVMPPDAPLQTTQIRDLEEWIRQGAVWPGSTAGGKQGEVAGQVPLRKPGPIRDDERKWWTFQSLKVSQPPGDLKGEPWARTEIDRFLLQAMERKGLKPSLPAHPEDQLRRLFLNLTGLPPKPEDVLAWKTDPSEEAYVRLVDRLLASPEHAQAWASRWLDLVRYADSDGYRIDHERPNAWRYRDYVIESFAQNRPMDRFLQEQIAGDELFPGDDRALIATGFLRHGIYEYNNRDARGQWNVILNDITDTVGDAFLGLGLQCARCHDHKYDPLLQVDYFRLRAFFANILPREDRVIADETQKAKFEADLAVWNKATETIRAKLNQLEKPHRESITRVAIERFPPDMQEIMRKPAKDRSPLETQLKELAWRQVDYDLINLDAKIKGAQKDEWLALRRELAKFDSIKPKPLPVAMSLVETGPISAPTPHPKKPSEDVLPGFPTLLDPQPASVVARSDSSGRRAAFASWLTSPNNPLTARVLVNRVWAWHTGRGLAPQPSDTGRLGGEPTHPELLDWLTDRFIKSGWNLRELHRLIVLSSFYRQSTQPSSDQVLRDDPDNRLYTRHLPRRLRAEEIRDCVFAASGELVSAQGGPGKEPGSPCRAVNLKVLRNSRNPFLEVFDLPQSITSTTQRDSTTTALQSLFLWNSANMVDRSRAMAQRLMREEPDEAKRVARAWLLTQSRLPDEEQTRQSLAFLRNQERLIEKQSQEKVVRVPLERMPHHEGQAVNFTLKPAGPLLESPWDSAAEGEDFTVELFFLARSISDTGTVRTLVARHDGNKDHPGWSLGLTGKQSRRKPQTLVLQLFGKQDKSTREIALFSDQKVELGHPYQLAVSLKHSRGAKPGLVRFYLRDLSNPDEPAQEATLEWSGKESLASSFPMRIGSRPGATAGIEAPFDGLIDDVRIVKGFFSGPAGGVGMASTGIETGGPDLGRWTFESQTGVLKDLSGKGRNLRTAEGGGQSESPRLGAWTDFCHVLFNSSGFLYAP